MEKELQLERLEKTKKLSKRTVRLCILSSILISLMVLWFPFNIYHHYSQGDIKFTLFYSVLLLIYLPIIYINIKNLKQSKNNMKVTDELIGKYELKDD